MEIGIIISYVGFATASMLTSLAYIVAYLRIPRLRQHPGSLIFYH